MTSHFFSRREFSSRVASFFPGLAITTSIFGLGRASPAAGTAASDEISRTAERIHQEVTFKASQKRVYDALTDAREFTKITEFTEIKNAAPAEISRNVGGAFSLFGGRIVGRHVELLPNRRIVQAWRVATWDEGVYSIARFELKEQGAETKIVFDHTGFPNGRAEHLAAGWKANYWEPLEKYLATM